MVRIATDFFLDPEKIITPTFHVTVPEAVTQSSAFTSTQRTSFGRLQSIRAFNVTSEANEMLKGLRYFERASKNSIPPKPAMSWGKVSLRNI